MNKFTRMVVLQGIFLTQMVVLQGYNLRDYLPSMTQVSNAIGKTSDYVEDAQSISDIINNARNLMSDRHRLNPAVRNKVARLSLKINKNIRALTILTRQKSTSGTNKKNIAFAIIKHVEQIGIYSKEIYRLYHQ